MVLRYYIKTDDGVLRRLPKAFFDDRAPLAALAGRRVRIVEAVMGGERLVKAAGRVILLTGQGHRDREGLGPVDGHRVPAGVIDLAARRRRARGDGPIGWELSAGELDAIRADMLPAGHRQRRAVPLYRRGAA